MSISLPDSPLDARVDALAAAQPLSPSRAQMVRGILEQACVAFERSGDPDAWKFPAAGSSRGQSDSDAAGSVRPTTITPTSKDASSNSAVPPARAGAAKSAA